MSEIPLSNFPVVPDHETLVDFLRNSSKIPKAWWLRMAGLLLINLSSIFFLPRTEAWVVLGSVLLAGTIMTVPHAKLGYVRL